MKAKMKMKRRLRNGDEVALMILQAAAVASWNNFVPSHKIRVVTVDYCNRISNKRHVKMTLT